MFPTNLQVRNIDVLFSLSQGKYIALVNPIRMWMKKMEKYTFRITLEELRKNHFYPDFNPNPATI